MEDSEDEDPIEELCEYLDNKVGHHCEVEHINATDTATFYKICYEYKKGLRKGEIQPCNRPQLAFRDILAQFDEHRVTQQLRDGGINSWKSKDPEWTVHARSVIKELYDIFLNAKVKHPNMLNIN